jgi:hypothetical protein
VRAEADAHVKRFLEMPVDRGTELVHGFAVQADEEHNRVALLFDSDAPGPNSGETAAEGR